MVGQVARITKVTKEATESDKMEGREPTEEDRQRFQKWQEECKLRAKARAEAFERKYAHNCFCYETFKKIESILEHIRVCSMGMMKDDPEKGGSIVALLLKDFGPKLDALADNPMNERQEQQRECHAKQHEFPFWDLVTATPIDD